MDNTKKLDEILEEIKNIKNELKIIKENIKQYNSDISTHVDFVQEVYDKIKYPFYKIMSLGNRIGNNSASAYPEIE